jgi:hypothetical protein
MEVEETHEKQQVVAIFCDMTGMSDKHKAAVILSKTAWDLNEAVMVHMSNPEPGDEGIFSAVGEQAGRMQIAGKENHSKYPELEKKRTETTPRVHALWKKAKLFHLRVVEARRMALDPGRPLLARSQTAQPRSNVALHTLSLPTRAKTTYSSQCALSFEQIRANMKRVAKYGFTTSALKNPQDLADFSQLAVEQQSDAGSLEERSDEAGSIDGYSDGADSYSYQEDYVYDSDEDFNYVLDPKAEDLPSIESGLTPGWDVEKSKQDPNYNPFEDDPAFKFSIAYHLPPPAEIAVMQLLTKEQGAAMK